MFWVFMDNMDEVVVWEIGVEFFLFCVVIDEFVDVWVEVVEFVFGDCYVGGFWYVRIDFDGVDECFVEFFWCDVVLVFIVVVCYVYDIIVVFDLNGVLGVW